MISKKFFYINILPTAYTPALGAHRYDLWRSLRAELPTHHILSGRAVSAQNTPKIGVFAEHDPTPKI